MSKKLMAAATFFLLIVYSCSKSGDTANGGSGGSGNYTPNCTTTKTFSADAAPVFVGVCATNSGCHGNGSGNGPGELSTYTQIFNARSAIRSAVASGRMPKTGTLTNAQKDAVLCWIDSGAPNN